MMRADARRNYERLVEVASEAFHRDGTETSLEEVAKAAGVGIGTLYRHFPTRQSLVLAVLDQGQEGMLGRARELLATAPPEEALLDWVGGLISHTARYRGLAREYLIGFQGNGEELQSSCDELKGVGEDLLKRAQEAGAIRGDLSVSDLLKLVSAVAWITECGTGDDGDRILGLTLDGLRVR